MTVTAAVQVFVAPAAAMFAVFALLLLLHDRVDAVATQRDRAERIAERADEQYRQYLAGDPRGVYGRFPPADLDTEPAERWTDPTGYEWVP